MIKIGIILGSTRKGRRGKAVADWITKFAQERNDGNTYELVDLVDYDLPFYGSQLTAEREQVTAHAINTWTAKMASLDGYIFVTPEYNHATSGVLKNAIDHVNAEINNKACGFVGYGALGGVRAIENLRLIVGELQVADVRTAVTFSIMTDFEMMDFKPAHYHMNNANDMLDQLRAWSTALKMMREGRQLV